MYLTQSLSRAVTINPNGAATIMGERVQTWSQTADRIYRLAAGLALRGIQKGDRIAILALNSDRYFELMYAIPAVGGIMVPLNTRLAPPEITYMLGDSGARMLFVDDAFLPVVAQLPSRAGVTDIVHIGDGAPGMSTFGSLLAETALAESHAGGDDIAGIYYTGGTTGRAKGVMLTHTNLAANAAMVGPGFGYRFGSIYMHAAPMFHLADGASTFAVTLHGCTHAFVPRFDPALVLHKLACLRVTNCLLVPTMINALIHAPGLTEHDLSCLRVVQYGASPMPAAVLAKAVAALPHVKFQHVYGMTEASPLATQMDLDDLPREGRRLQSCGRPGALLELRICDAEDHEVPRDTVGEIQLRGPNIMKGYWKQPEATASAMRGGWYHTGDGGVMDADGYVYIVDRMKDMIITGGENVYSAEVESAISTLDGVAEVAVIGIPDPTWGEAVHAIVVPRAEYALTAEQVIAHCRGRVAGFKCPRSVDIRDTSLPLSGAGKVLKTELRAPYWEHQTHQVS